ncbi:hypothetical protein Cni_G28974 [Canna indica]|uniref:Uncharacterized protein n=1 Tax=Canna indica TaxID=4628 RepID=A0AAQ3L893_9LILI|nr:hypothetical protein Cni_G28974 [Canna indica]
MTLEDWSEILIKASLFVLVQALVYFILSNSSTIFSSEKMRTYSFRTARSASFRRMLTWVSDLPSGGPHLTQGCPERQALSVLIAETVVETMSNVSMKKDKGKGKAVSSASHSGGSSSDHSSEDEYNERTNIGAVQLLNVLKTQVGEQKPTTKHPEAMN